MRFSETEDRRGSNSCQTKMKSITILLCLVALVGSAYGLTCPCDSDINFTCKDEPTEESCAYGLVNDACNCCQECARGPDEECGGPWGVLGTCAEGHTCMRVPGGHEDSLGFEGACQEGTPERTDSSTHSPSSTTHTHSSTTHSDSSTTRSHSSTTDSPSSTTDSHSSTTHSHSSTTPSE